MPLSVRAVMDSLMSVRFMAKMPTSTSGESGSWKVCHRQTTSERRRDLLLGLEADDVGNLLPLDRRQRHEPGEAVLPGDGQGDGGAGEVLAGRQLQQRVADDGVRVVFAGGENLGMVDDVEGLHLQLAIDELELQRLEGAPADVDAPYALGLCHTRSFLLGAPPPENRRSVVCHHTTAVY